ncbi:MAG: acetamidase, partial [Cytophagaceae bacterium]|nr:acetamidase [Gemmatimonadaceae bacterium]
MTRLVRLLPIAFAAASGVGAQQVHKLPATPQTVVYGYYWSEAKPALRIKSGDIIDVETMLTSTPTRLEQAGLPAADVQQSLRDIVAQ